MTLTVPAAFLAGYYRAFLDINFTGVPRDFPEGRGGGPKGPG